MQRLLLIILSSALMTACATSAQKSTEHQPAQTTYQIDQPCHAIQSLSRGEGFEMHFPKQNDTEWRLQQPLNKFQVEQRVLAISAAPIPEQMNAVAGGVILTHQFTAKEIGQEKLRFDQIRLSDQQRLNTWQCTFSIR